MQDQATTATAIPPVTPLGQTATAGPWTLTVTDVSSGDAAAKTISDTNDKNPTAPDGLVYVLAKVKADNTGSVALEIGQSDFLATGSDGTLRPSTSMAVPTPALQGVVDPGKSLEGWLPMTVDDASKATLWFDSSSLPGAWDTLAFALADGAVVPTFKASETGDAKLGTDPASPAGLNQAVQTGDWAITVIKTADGQQVYDMSNYELQALAESDSTGTEIATWLGVYARVTNLSDYPTFFSPNAFTLTDSTGDPWDNIQALTAPDPDISRELLPGASREGWFVFEQQSYVTDAVLRVLPSAVADTPRYFSLDGAAGSDTTTADATAPAGASADGDALTVATGDKVVTTDGPVNLRATAAPDGDIVAELDKGTVLTVTGDPIEADGYRWYPVSVDDTGDTGYVVQDYIAAQSS